VTEDSGRPPLSVRTKSLYGLGESVATTAQTAVDTFLLFYLTAVVGLSGTLAGAAMFIALIVDGVADPLIGYASDNTRSRYGRRHPFMLIGAVPLALAVGMVFSTPIFEAESWRFVYILCVLLLLRISLSFFALPYIALGAELTQDYRERSVVQAYRTVFWIAAYALTMFICLGVFLKGQNSLLDRHAYLGLGWTCAAVALILGLVTTFGTFGARPPMSPKAPGRHGASGGIARLVKEVSDVVHNRSFVVLFLSVLTFWVAQGVANSLWLHTSKYFWQLPPSVLQVIPITGSIGFAVGIPFTALALARFDKLNVAVASLAIISLIQIVPALLRLLHLLPEAGVPLYAVLGGLQLALGCTSTSLGIAFPSMMADAADEHELLFGSRREGLYFAGLTLSAKAASGAGAFVAGLGLDVIGFPTHLADAGSVAIGADVIRDLGVMWGPGAGLISLLSVAALRRYRLDARELARIQRELRYRHTAPDAP
jgi:GPH family glycoside/pentoside/hexuronide:cation symporter